MEALFVVALDPSFETVEKRPWEELIVDVGILAQGDHAAAEDYHFGEVCEGMTSSGARVVIRRRRQGCDSVGRYAIGLTVLDEELRPPPNEVGWTRISKSIGGKDAFLGAPMATGGDSATAHRRRRSWFSPARKSLSIPNAIDKKEKRYLWVRWASTETRLHMAGGIYGISASPAGIAIAISGPLGVADTIRKVSVVDSWPPPHAMVDHIDIPLSAMPNMILGPEDASICAEARGKENLGEPTCFVFSVTESDGRRSFVSVFKFREVLDEALTEALVSKLAEDRAAADNKAWQNTWDDDELEDENDDDDHTVADRSTLATLSDQRDTLRRRPSTTTRPRQASDMATRHHDRLLRRTSISPQHPPSTDMVAHAVTCICIVWRRRSARRATWALARALRRIALSGPGGAPALRTVLAAFRGLEPPEPASRFSELRAIFVDAAGDRLPQLEPLVLRPSLLEAAGLTPIGDPAAWKLMRSFRPEELVRLIEALFTERSICACASTASPPALFVDALRVLVFPLQWTLPSVDRMPLALAADLLQEDAVVPLLAGCVVPRLWLPAQGYKAGAIGGLFNVSSPSLSSLRASLQAGPDVVLIDLDNAILDFGTDLRDRISSPRSALMNRGNFPRLEGKARAELLAKLTASSSRSQDSERRHYSPRMMPQDEIYKNEDEGLEIREAVLRPMSRLLVETQRFVKEPESNTTFFGRGLGAYFDSDGFVAAVGSEHGHAFVSALVESQSFSHFVQRMVEIDENDLGLVFFFDIYAAAVARGEEKSLEQCIEDIFRERLKAPSEIATFDLPLAGLQNKNDRLERRSSATFHILLDDMPLARYGALAGLFGDDPLTEYAEAEEAVASSVARLKASVRSSDAVEKAAKYRRSLLVRDLRSPRDYFEMAKKKNSKDFATVAISALGALEACFFACIPRLIRRTGVELADADDGITDDEIGIVFLRALGLLSHAERACGSNFISTDGAVARALFLAAAQLRAVAATESMRAFAAAAARALYQSVAKPPPPKTFAVFAAAAALDTDFHHGLDASVCRGEDSTLREQYSSARNSLTLEARDLPPRLVDAAHSTVAWLERAGRAWCEEHDLSQLCPINVLTTTPTNERPNSKKRHAFSGLTPTEKDETEMLLPKSVPLVAMWPIDRCDECQSYRGDAEILAAALGLPPPCAHCKKHKRSKPAQLAVRSWRLFDSEGDGDEIRLYDYLEPGKMRNRLEALLTDRGEKALDDLLTSDPTLFFGFLWFFARLHVPLPMRAGPRARCVIALVQGDDPDIVLSTCESLLTDTLRRPGITDVASPPTSPPNSARRRSLSSIVPPSPASSDAQPDPVEICRRLFGDVDPHHVNYVFC